MTDQRREGLDFWVEVDLEGVEVDLVEEEVDLVEKEVVDLGVVMVVCFVERVEEEEAGGVASQGLSRLRNQELLFVE